MKRRTSAGWRSRTLWPHSSCRTWGSGSVTSGPTPITLFQSSSHRPSSGLLRWDCARRSVGRRGRHGHPGTVSGLTPFSTRELEACEQTAQGSNGHLRTRRVLSKVGCMCETCFSGYFHWCSGSLACVPWNKVERRPRRSESSEQVEWCKKARRSRARGTGRLFSTPSQRRRRPGRRPPPAASSAGGGLPPWTFQRMRSVASAYPKFALY